MEDKNIWDFIFELGQQKLVERSGWKLAGIKERESIAEHSLRTAQIAYILAKLEKYENPFEVCTIAVFHEIGECRTGDINKIANRYIKCDEEICVKEQTENLGEIGKDIFLLWKRFEKAEDKAGVIARDADLLELAITAKELLEKGYKTEDWINNQVERLQTKSAKKLATSLKEMKSTDWWKGIKKFSYLPEKVKSHYKKDQNTSLFMRCKINDLHQFTLGDYGISDFKKNYINCNQGRWKQEKDRI